MKILVRDKKQASWKKAVSKVFASPMDLKDLLCDSPDLVPFSENDVQEARVCLKDLDFPGSGGTELLMVDEHGVITLVECVLSADPIKKRVIGQLMGYAAYLWQKSYLELDLMFFDKTGKGFLESFQEKKGKEKLDEDKLKNNVIFNLSSGIFRMLIVSDRIDEEVKRTINFLRQSTSSSCDIYGLQMCYFFNENVEMVIPELFGSFASIQMGESKKPDTTEMISFEPRNLYKEIYEFSLKNFQKQFADRTKKPGAYAFWINRNDDLIPLYTILDKGLIQLNVNGLRPFLEDTLADNFLKKLHVIPSLKKLDFNSTYPMFKLDELFRTREEIDKFKAAFLYLKKELVGKGGEK